MKLHACLRTLVTGFCASLLLAALLSAAPVQAADGAPANSGARPPTAAQTGGHNAAPVWREVRQGDAGVTTIKGAETGVLVQTDGNAWRALRNGPVTLIGGLLVIIVAAAILAFHAWKGPMRLSARPSGRTVARFNRLELVAHNTAAVCFVLLAIGGLLMLFGKHVLMPVLGHTVLSVLLQILKPLHNFLGLVFAVAVLTLIVMWAKDNVWDRFDAEWIRRAGGLLDRSHVPSARFNFGEKVWFWFGVTMLGLTAVVSGFLLDFPGILELRTNLQTANLVHAVAGVLMTAMALGHIYIGTLGVEGALDAMKTGDVDEEWARQHHSAWLEEVTAKKRA